MRPPGSPKAGKLISIAGGGDTVRALNVSNVAGDFTYVSTAGGAFLEWLAGRELPAVAALAVVEESASSRGARAAGGA